MKLSKDSLKDRKKWADAGISIPSYDIDEAASRTELSPKWIHFGAGNIFRGYIAGLQDTLLRNGLAETGIIAVESFDFEIIDSVYSKTDNLTLNVLMGADGNFDLRVNGSIARGMTTRKENGDYARLRDYFLSPDLQIVSFTVTEKGYSLRNIEGGYLPSVQKDIENGPESPEGIMPALTSLLHGRYRAGKLPVALVSMDNCSDNGDRLKSSVLAVAEEWCRLGFTDSGFLDYLNDENLVSFPLSMIDKITPRPADSVRDYLQAKGLEYMETVITSFKTYMAPFVNAEVPEYLVIEDRFPNGRPPLEKAGVLFTDRETVKKTEKMKVTTCLNPLHTALAVTGCLLGYRSISDEMKDPELLKLVMKIGYDEGLPVAVDPGIINPQKFIDEVVNERLPNPYIPDTPQRIASDTSQKVGIRFGETIKAHLKNGTLGENGLIGIKTAIASWCRYLLGVDDEGRRFQLSPDPLADYLLKCVEGISVGGGKADISQLLSNSDIFGLDLYSAGIAGDVEKIFMKMTEKKGGVRSALKEFLG